ncbi:protein TolQ [Thiomicrospira sp. WB1]|uniref:protein TolQ n=1 Tax=Thiomicrospira sp. WB1 TaxID=1685380 RepID=UPI000746979F|nr:protein TolQ [Thiomicrospira sp. WB1]KUJ72941.1 protein TolQ [Thiomicrospira sp. WB1]
MENESLMQLVLSASAVVQAVMILLLIMSVMAWTVTIAKSVQIRRAKQAAQAFDQKFWQSSELTSLYHEVSQQPQPIHGNQAIFDAGFSEFVRLKKQGVDAASDLIAGTQRAMKVAFTRQVGRLENHVALLATVGSSAPYIGLFGTVWGVMHAFTSLGDVKNATLAAVAPGISEALIATAIGLFAAIPAVIAYNRLTVKLEQVTIEYENFAEGFLSIIQRQAHSVEESQLSH